MPESPDFDQVARGLADALDEDFTFARASQIESKIAEQLRLVWNARGAADIQAVNDDLALLGSAGVSPGFKRAIGNLDR